MTDDFNVNMTEIKTPEQKEPIRIHATLVPKVNLAFHQNSVPTILELAIINESEGQLKDVELILTSLDFFKEKIWRADVVEPNQHFRFTGKSLDVPLDVSLLSRLTESESTQACFTLLVSGEEIARHEISVELLARNQWGGIGHMPEMIAAFVQPNEPAVEHVLKKTAEILRKHGKSSALTGYEGGPKRAWELVSAIWTSIGTIGLDYSLPPASFETAGQKIRNPGQIVEAGIATCLDTTLFFCAAIEQCGLNPLIIFTKGHVLAGFWLKNEEFATVVVDDITALRKRVKLKELVLIETTLATQHPCPGFGRSVDEGAANIAASEEEKFQLIVDVRRARLQRIKPLSTDQVTTPSGEHVSTQEELGPVFEEAPDLPDDEIVRQEELEPTRPQTRLDKWQRKLLDLSLRNSLLNFRTTKRAIRLEAPDPEGIVDLLADGQTLTLLPIPDLMNGTDPRSQAIHETRTNENLRREHALDVLSRKQLMVNLPKEELEGKLVELYRFARSILQEGGANTLFLALGFLSWTRDDKHEKRYKAPLILIPITINRRSVRSGFTMKLHDDEPRFNPTLVEMLRHDFNLDLAVAEGELSKDIHSLDIDGMWKTVAKAVKDIRGWEVVEDLVLSTFSFAKHLMWKDLVDRTDQLKENPVVKHLLDTPRDPYPFRVEFPNPKTLDRTHRPEQNFCPLPADSSQLSAVIAAANGKDFVLIGPPGTGKSQTIANIITQCLAEQKTVLFVSEKIAALNVVYRRLKEIGLGDFCLELHSNKARKLDVLNNLGQAWAAKGEVDVAEWKREAERLKALRDHLNDFVEHLHRKRHNGLTAYRAIGRIVAGKDLPRVGLTWPSANAHDKDALFNLANLVEDLDINAREVGEIANSPLAMISHGEWSPNWTQSMVKAARDLIPAAEALRTAASEFLKATGLPELSLNSANQEGLSMFSSVLPDAAGRDYRFTLLPDVRVVVEGLNEGLKLLSQHRETKAGISAPWSTETCQKVEHGLQLISRHSEAVVKLSAPYEKNGAALDAKQLKEDWEKAEKFWWPMSWLAHKKVRSTLSEIVEGKHELVLPSDIERLIKLRNLEAEINGLAELSTKTTNLWAGFDTKFEEIKEALEFQPVLTVVHKGTGWPEKEYEIVASGKCGEEMAVDLECLQKLQVLENEIAKLDHLHSKTSGIWGGLNTNTEELERALRFQVSLSEAVAKLATSAESFSEIKKPLERLLGDGNALLEPGGPVPTTGKSFIETLDRYTVTVDDLALVTGTSSSDIQGVAGNLPEILAEKCSGILQLEPKLRAWCAWRKIRGEAIARGLAPLVSAVEDSVVGLGNLREVFETDYARWWLNATVDGDDVLRLFVSATHEKRIEDYRALDDRFTDLTKQYVRAELCGQLPDQNDVTRNSEWGLLRHEMQKRRRHLPLRELVNRIPSAMTKLAPCIMMSPLSIAQYLSTDTAIFDIVVFDEASQIAVWDAIGAIARGKQVVMVGDPKQLPPTSFFDRVEVDGDEDMDVEADLESILDECLGGNLPTLNLSWHYRSRHESLIAFSNNRYYGGELVTFPSPITEDRAVSLQLVHDGVYEKGGARINKPEARALVKHIVSRLKDHGFQASKLTIGVVTFNSEQQRLIEDLLDDERRKSPSIESFFAEDIIEPLFVKNLESVQGDERDIMYFSITYGPDHAGSISMNFGPINRDGGERRLNVAVTRARHELLVFSSMRPEQMDLSRTQAAGVRDLKHFMEFAERGPKAIAEAVYGTIGDFDSPFEQSVAEALVAKGWQVHPQVGVSSFRIDLGIVDPDFPGRYLSGVECDGATYHRSATARDRDKLREQVLRGLGWEILRIWSTDWWVDSEGALMKVHADLERLLEERRRQHEEEQKKLKETADVKTSTEIRHTAEESKNSDGSTHEEDTKNEIPLPLSQEPKPPELYTGSTNLVAGHGDVNGKVGSPESPFTTETEGEGLGLVNQLHTFAPYQEYEGPFFGDPREINRNEIANGLWKIIEIEGPMLTKRAYDIYLRGCNIKRMGRELKSMMNKALQSALKRGLVVVEDELNTQGLVKTYVRIKGTPTIKLRERGPRTFEEIPPSEVLVASSIALKEETFLEGSDEHMHAILELFELKRLTSQTRERLFEILKLDLL